MLKKITAALLSIMMVFAMAVPAVTAQTTDETTSVLGEITLSDAIVSMTAEKTITATVPYNGTKADFEATEWEWTWDDKPFSEWKCWTSGSTYDGDPFITVNSFGYNEETGNIELSFSNALLYGTTDLSNGSRPRIKHLFGNHPLKLTGTKGDDTYSTETTLRLATFDHDLSYQELNPAIDAALEKSKAMDDRYLEYRAIGYSTLGKEIPMGIVAKDKEDIDYYLNTWLPMATEDPQAAAELVKSGVDYKIPLWLDNIHSDEQPGIDAMVTLFDQFATEDTITYKTSTKTEKVSAGYGRDTMNVPTEDDVEEEITLNVDELLDNFIIIFVFSINPDGRDAVRRSTETGFDPNRDITYQTQPELIATMSEIAKWMPASMIEFHGYVNNFLIEPCTAPHDPNYEYDLLAPLLVEHAYAMGKAGIAMSDSDGIKYDRFVIPYEDYDTGLDGGWDDASPMYTPVAAMHYGLLGHTVEIPDMNENSYLACLGVAGANMKFMLDNKDRVYLNQLEYWTRAVNNVDLAEKVDEYFVDVNGDVVGRPREDGKAFFPDYYVIPVGDSQINNYEAYNLVEYGLRNQWKITTLNEDTTVDGVLYPAGSFVIDMRQARRGWINGCLYKGYDTSSFSQLYAETIINFPAMRGFDCDGIWNKGVFDGKTTPYTALDRPDSGYVYGASKYIIKNNSNEAVKAINKILNDNKQAQLILSDIEGVAQYGDFLVPASSAALVKDMQLDMIPYEGSAAVQEIEKPKIYFTSTQYEIRWMLDYLGFEWSNDPEGANVIISNNSTDVKSLIEQGIPYIGLSTSPLSFLSNQLGINVTTSGSNISEGLLKADYAQDSFATKGYEAEGTVYMKGRVLSDLPENVKPLVTIADSDAYIAGVDRTDRTSYLGKAVAFTTDYNGTPITLFGMNIQNKANTQGYYRLLANAVFAGTADVTDADINNVPAQEITVDMDKTSVAVNETFQMKITTPIDVMDIALINEYGKDLGISIDNVELVNDSIVWTISSAIGTKGERNIEIYTDLGNGLQPTGTSIAISVGLPSTSFDIAPELYSVSTQGKVFMVNKNIPVEVITNTSVSKIKITNEYGSDIGLSNVTYTDEGDTRTWNLNIAVGTKGSRVFTVSAIGKDGLATENTESFRVQIIK